MTMTSATNNRVLTTTALPPGLGIVSFQACTSDLTELRGNIHRLLGDRYVY